MLGTHGRRGIGRFVLGSDAEQILRGAEVPVLVRGEREPASASMAGIAQTAVTASARLATAAV